MLDIDIEQINSPSVRTFQPDRNDKSGRTALAVANAPAGATYRWAASPRRRAIHCPECASDIHARRAAPASGRLAFKSTTPRAATAARQPPGSAFRNSWRFASIPAHTPRIGRQERFQPGSTPCCANMVWPANATSSCNRRRPWPCLLRRANVRMVWEIAPFFEQLPPQFQAGNFAEHFYTPLHLAGFPAVTRQNSASVVEQIKVDQIGITDRPGGARPAQGVIEIHPGAIDSGGSVVARTAAIVRQAVLRAEKGVDCRSRKCTAPAGVRPAPRPVARNRGADDRRRDGARDPSSTSGRSAGVGRCTHCFVRQSICPAPESTSPSRSGPASGCRIILRKFSDAGTYTDAGFNGLTVLNDQNQAMVEVMFGVPPAHPFE